MSTPEANNFHDARLAVFEHLRGELMSLMGIIPSELTKHQLLEAMNEMGDVAEAVLQMLDFKVVGVSDGRIVASVAIGKVS